MHALLICTSTILVAVSSLIYARSIITASTRPHRTTRFVLLLITVLSTAALLDSGGAAFILAFVSMVQALGLFILSLKRGMGGWSKLDMGCLIIALFGILLWQISGNPMIGLWASIIADTVGMIPAFVKTHRQPETEDWRFFAIDTVAGCLSLAALTTWTIYSMSYPIYIVLINAAMAWLILVRQKRSRRSSTL